MNMTVDIPGWNGKFSRDWRSYSKEQIKELYEIVHQKVWKRNFNKKDILWLIFNIDSWSSLSVLDVGCAIGHMGAFLHRFGTRRYCGLDVSDIAIKKAWARLHKLQWLDLQFISSYIEDNKLSETYDVVLCSHTLEHVLDLKKAIAKMKEIADKYIAIVVPMQMKPGGKSYHTHIFPHPDILVDAVGLDQYQVDVRTPAKGRRIIRYIGRIP